MGNLTQELYLWYSTVSCGSSGWPAARFELTLRAPPPMLRPPSLPGLCPGYPLFSPMRREFLERFEDVVSPRTVKRQDTSISSVVNCVLHCFVHRLDCWLSPSHVLFWSHSLFEVRRLGSQQCGKSYANERAAIAHWSDPGLVSVRIVSWPTSLLHQPFLPECECKTSQVRLSGNCRPSILSHARVPTLPSLCRHCEGPERATHC